jgi:hypothetical protein
MIACPFNQPAKALEAKGRAIMNVFGIKLSAMKMIDHIFEKSFHLSTFLLVYS